AYGMNDVGYASATHFSGCIERMMQQIRQAVPAVEFVLVAPMLPHPEWDYPVPGRIEEYRDGLAQLCGKGVVLADVTSLWSALLARKSTYDLSGNGINHPNDFGHRLYAQTILALLVDGQADSEVRLDSAQGSSERSRGLKPDTTEHRGS